MIQPEPHHRPKGIGLFLLDLPCQIRKLCLVNQRMPKRVFFPAHRREAWPRLHLPDELLLPGGEARCLIIIAKLYRNLPARPVKGSGDGRQRHNGPVILKSVPMMGDGRGALIDGQWQMASDQLRG